VALGRNRALFRGYPLAELVSDLLRVAERPAGFAGAGFMGAGFAGAGFAADAGFAGAGFAAGAGSAAAGFAAAGFAGAGCFAADAAGFVGCFAADTAGFVGCFAAVRLGAAAGFLGAAVLEAAVLVRRGFVGAAGAAAGAAAGTSARGGRCCGGCCGGCAAAARSGALVESTITPQASTTPAMAPARIAMWRRRRSDRRCRLRAACSSGIAAARGALRSCAPGRGGAGNGSTSDVAS
jgi:hypothetical protein